MRQKARHRLLINVASSFMSAYAGLMRASRVQRASSMKCAIEMTRIGTTLGRRDALCRDEGVSRVSIVASFAACRPSRHL